MKTKISSYRLHYKPRSQAYPIFCSSVCIDHNTEERQKNREGLHGSIHHVTLGGCKVDVGGVGPIVDSASTRSVHRPVG